MQPQFERIVSKLEELSPERLAEVVDFIDFLRARDQDQHLVRDYAQASEAAFAKVWDNDEDASLDESVEVFSPNDLSEVAGMFKGRSGPKTDEEIEAGLQRHVR